MDLGRVLHEDLTRLREERPLIHHITNYVAMNDSANATLAIGASPVMAHAHSELKDLVSAASALLINIGTLDDYWIQSMHIAAEIANNRIPILLDPVGAGATKLRTATAMQLLTSYKISVVKGNYGEMLSLMGEENAVRGVDSLASSAEKVYDAIREFSSAHRTIAIATGEVDVVSDGESTYLLKNGTTELGSITASGCMLGSIIASFLAVQKDPLVAAIEGVATYTIAGELAAKKNRKTGSFRVALLDELSSIDADTVLERINWESY